MKHGIIVLALSLASPALAWVGPQRLVVTKPTTTLLACPGLKCGYVLEMCATSNIVLPMPLDFQALVIKAYQSPSCAGGFVPTFVPNSKCPTIKWMNGTAPAPILTKGKTQMYSLVGDVKTEATCVYNEMRQGAE
jgi:hypothetical protein